MKRKKPKCDCHNQVNQVCDFCQGLVDGKSDSVKYKSIDILAGHEYDPEYPEDTWWHRKDFKKSRCPFCGTKGLEVEYGTTGTEIYCAKGCHSRTYSPCFPFEFWEMWERYKKS